MDKCIPFAFSGVLRILLTAFILACPLFSSAQEIIDLRGEDTGEIGKSVLIREDPSKVLSIGDILRSDDKFEPSLQEVPSFSGTLSAIWVKFEIKNISRHSYFLLVDNPNLDNVDLYTISGGKAIHLQETGDLVPFNEREIKRNNFIFGLDLPEGEVKTFYIRYTGTEGMELPLKVCTAKALIEQSYLIDLINGIYYGIILVTILYNFFLFITIRDRSYLYYVLFVSFFALLQAELLGHTFQFLWPGQPWFNTQTLFLFSSISGIFALLFGRDFLHTKSSAPKLHRLGMVLIVLWLVIILLSILSPFLSETFVLINEYLLSVSGLLFSPYMMALGLVVYFRGYRPARFYMIAWVVILIGVVIYVLKSNGLLPHTFFTNSVLQIGSAAEAILLSLALGDRYNVLKKEKEATQNRLNSELEKANSKLVKTNADLDNFVYTASHDLKAPISNIEGLIDTLKSDPGYAQSGLNAIVDMMSLSVNKFKDTINDLTEITRVQKDIEEDQEMIGIAEVIEEIKILLKNQIEESRAELNVDLKACAMLRFSKKNFRSVIYNLIGNAIKYRSPDRSPKIMIFTERQDDFVVLVIRDNGLGIGPHHLDKVFQMFKRAHNHVEGTGLGLYLIKRIMENHGGKIELESIVGQGSIFKVWFKQDTMIS